MVVADKVWAVEEPKQFVILNWNADDEAVLFNVRDGATHFLDALASDLLNILSCAPCTIGSLVEAVKDSVQPDDWDRLPAFVESVLIQLQGYGLVVGRYN